MALLSINGPETLKHTLLTSLRPVRQGQEYVVALVALNILKVLNEELFTFL